MLLECIHGFMARNIWSIGINGMIPKKKEKIFFIAYTLSVKFSSKEDFEYPEKGVRKRKRVKSRKCRWVEMK